MTKFTKTLSNGNVVTLIPNEVRTNTNLDFIRGLVQQGYKLITPTEDEEKCGIIIIGTDFVTNDSVYFARFDFNYCGVWPIFAVYGVSGPFSGLFFMTRATAECYFENITAAKEPDDHDSGGRLLNELITYIDR